MEKRFTAGYVRLVIRYVTIFLAVSVCAGMVFSAPAMDPEYTRLDNVRLIPHSANDGDSFHVSANGTSYVVRLYGADCPETHADGDIYVRRVREQTRYFGVDSPWRTVQLGLRARDATQELLAEPFAVYTIFTPALGQSEGGRIYAFVILADGRDLTETLVSMGLARAYGVARRTPFGESREEYMARLSDLEMAAAMKRIGVWEYSDPERLVAMRAEARQQAKTEAEWRAKIPLSATGQGEIDINTADERELQLLSGIGPVLAQRIIEGRPYKTVDDLAGVRGINKRLLDQIRPFLRVSAEN